MFIYKANGAHHYPHMHTPKASSKIIRTYNLYLYVRTTYIYTYVQLVVIRTYNLYLYVRIIPFVLARVGLCGRSQVQCMAPIPSRHPWYAGHSESEYRPFRERIKPFRERIKPFSGQIRAIQGTHAGCSGNACRPFRERMQAIYGVYVGCSVKACGWRRVW